MISKGNFPAEWDREVGQESRTGAKWDRAKVITRAVMSGCPALISITLAYFPDLQERAAIKEFDAGLPRLDAELSTLLDELEEGSARAPTQQAREDAAKEIEATQEAPQRLAEA